MTGTDSKVSSTTAVKTEDDAAPQAVIINRTFNAPPNVVWQALTDPKHLVMWWGPETFTSPACHVDLRVGGKYHFCMRSPEGQDFWSTGYFREISPFVRLVMTDSFSDAEGNIISPTDYGMPADVPLEMLLTMTLEDLGKKTKFALRIDGMPAGQMRAMAVQGWNGSFDKLDAALETRTILYAEPGKQETFITRIFNAPPERVFKAMVDPAAIPQWWGPSSLSTNVESLEAKPGGFWRFVQSDPEGNTYAFHGAYHQVSSPARLVYTFEFEGEPDNVILEIVTLEDLGGRTRMIDHSVYESVEVRDAMILADMESGMGESMERLEALLAAG